MNSLGGAETFPAHPGAIFGHQGGWDELLLVLGPLVVVGLLLWLANKRVTAQLDRAENGPASSAAPSGSEEGRAKR